MINYAFLHGGGQGGWAWQETIAALEGQVEGSLGQVLALDVPGCGVKRQRQTENITIEDVAKELVADIEAAGLENVVLVGHSQAGQAMCYMVKQRPELFKRLIYVTCSLPLTGQNVLQMIGQHVHGENEQEVGWPLDPNTSDMAQRYQLMFCNDMTSDMTADFMAKLGLDMWPQESYTHTDWPYEHLGRVPASYVLCLQDKSLPVIWQETFARRFRVDKVVRIDAGHQVMNTRPHSLAETIRCEALREGGAGK